MITKITSSAAVYLHAHRRLSISQTELKVQQIFRLHTQLCTQNLHQGRMMLLRLHMEDKADSLRPPASSLRVMLTLTPPLPQPEHCLALYRARFYLHFPLIKRII